MIVISNDWRHMFNDPDFRLGWQHARMKTTALPDVSLFYRYGRQMALETKRPLPAIDTLNLTPEMRAVIHDCPAFVNMIHTSDEIAERAKIERADLLRRLQQAERSEATNLEARRADLRRRMTELGISGEGRRA